MRAAVASGGVAARWACARGEHGGRVRRGPFGSPRQSLWTARCPCRTLRPAALRVEILVMPSPLRRAPALQRPLGRVGAHVGWLRGRSQRLHSWAAEQEQFARCRQVAQAYVDPRPSMSSCGTPCARTWSPAGGSFATSSRRSSRSARGSRSSCLRRRCGSTRSASCARRAQFDLPGQRPDRRAIGQIVAMGASAVEVVIADLLTSRRVPPLDRGRDPRWPGGGRCPRCWI